MRLGALPIAGSAGHDTLEPITHLIADEVVFAHGAAEIGPVTGAPIFDETGLAREGLETLGPAHGGVVGVPEFQGFLAGQQAEIGHPFLRL